VKTAIKLLIAAMLLMTLTGCTSKPPLDKCRSECASSLYSVVIFENVTNIYSCTCSNKVTHTNDAK
jgi:starvation-inducible outer membrane lipoprotein